MHFSTRGGHRFARPGLESLEGRTLLSSAPLTAASLADTIQVRHLLPVQHPAKAAFALSWAITPAAVLEGTNSTTGDGKSTGSVDFALARGAAYALEVGGRARSEPAGFVVTTSSANAAHPDVYHTPFTLRVRVRDAASGLAGILYFKGTISGKLTAGHSTLAVSFQSPHARKLTLGSHVYTVTLPAVLHPGAPGATPATLHASVGVTARTSA
jgi:hypothetical protein